MIRYEWTLETLEDGDIVDSDFSDRLTFGWVKIADSISMDLGLVRNEGNDIDGITDRLWAYVKNGKLPEYFTDAMREPTGYKVPQKFHNELSKYF